MDLKDKKTRITFYQGLRTIGGTHIQVNYEESSIYFDFGAEFNPSINEECLKCLDDILSINLSPRYEGVYDRRHTNENEDLYANKAVFVSHIHLDHTKMINFVDESIPVFMSNDTKSLLYALNEDRSFLFDNKLNSSATRDINGLNYGDKVTVGKIEVELVRVDHDGYGACGFIIKTPDLSIAYTGDIRFHGYLQKESLNFVEKAKTCDILMMEGVSVSFEDDPFLRGENIRLRSEENLLEEFEKLLDENRDRQITFNIYEANIERILKIIDLVESKDRQVIFDQYLANILKKVTGNEYQYYCLEEPRFELDPNLKVDLDYILANPSKYMLQIPYENLALLERLNKNSLYIHCDASPLGEFDIKYAPFVKLFKDNEINLTVLKCSGHAYPEDLNMLIDQVKPKILIPIHSQKPEMLYNKYGDRILPERKQTIGGRNEEK